MQHRPVHYAKLCAAAYWDSSYSFEGVECIRTDGGGETVFSFRGTEKNFADILTDIRGIPWPIPPWPVGPLGRCHSGFLKTTRAYWNRWLQWQVGAACENGKRIVFTGHSLGGARATIAAALSIIEFNRPISLITFGCPHTGFRRLGELIESRALRVERYIRGKDIVPSLPRGPWWHPVGPEIAIGKPRDRFLDHCIAGYVEDLR